MTYILYGLTRTGKSSVLDYFCERIKGKHINEDDSKTIMTFKWDFSGIEIKNTTRSVLWAYLLETNIYDKLSDELANTVDMEYSEHGFPEPDKLSQSDLETIIIALNKCDALTPNEIKKKVASIKRVSKKTPFTISAVAHQGTTDLMRAVIPFLK